MPSRTQPSWSPAQDMQIRRRRIEGASWETIAAELALPPRDVAARGHRLGAARSRTPGAAQDALREPLPAGHPDSWGALTAGTVLQGLPYPLPFFRH